MPHALTDLPVRTVTRPVLSAADPAEHAVTDGSVHEIDVPALAARITENLDS